MKSSDVKGVLTEKPVRAPKEPVPYAPDNMHISRDEFIKRRAAHKAAKAAAEEARNAVLAKHGLLSESPYRTESPASDARNFEDTAPVAKDSSGIQSKLEAARKKLVAAQEKQKSDPNSAYYNKRVRDLNQEVEDLENQL